MKNINLNGKKVFLIGFIAILLVGIPLTLFILQQQQDTRSKAAPSTTISFTPTSTSSAPLQKKNGDSIPFDIMVDPGSNLVSYVKLEILYDPDKLGAIGAATFTPNTVVFPTVLEGPVYTPGKIAVSLSVGPDPTKAIQQITKAGTVTFKALADTAPGTPTLVTYGSNTQVLSIGSGDQASENVLSGTTPATIIIGGAGEPTNAEIPTTIPAPTTPAAPTEVPIVPEVPTTAPTIADGGGVPGNNQSPICNSLTADREATGAVPFNITLTANGSDSDGTISKVTFNFGDGQVSDVTTGGGIGTATVNAPVSHTFNNAGSFQASAIITDNAQGISTTANCTLAVTVTDANTGGSNNAPTTANVSIAAPGSADVAAGIGIVAMLLLIGGGLLFFII